MPLIKESSYKPPFYLKNGHLATIIPNMLRKVNGVDYQRERIDTSDGDFLDLDWIRNKGQKLVIISHGLEGSSDRQYIRGAAKSFSNNGWDVLAWNCRSCSGELNGKPRLYHHAATEDLSDVIDSVINKYEVITLVGYSLGGSLILKYLGETGQKVDPRIKAAAVFSVPCDLKSSALELSKPKNRYYLKRFLKKLGKKIKAKSNQFPGIISYDGFDKITSFYEFDARYTAPLHGFRDADHFYQVASSKNYLAGLSTPILLVNAKNDPFLNEKCCPVEFAESSKHLFLEMPKYGGHVGFTSKRGNNASWSETRALEFFEPYVL